MREEPIKVSSEAWTGLSPSTPDPSPEPESRPPSLVKGVVASILLTVLSGSAVWQAVSTHTIPGRSRMWGPRTTLREGLHPLAFDMTASMHFVMMLAGAACTVFGIVMLWRKHRDAKAPDVDKPV